MMVNIWDFSVWGSLMLVGILLLSLLVANALKRNIPFLQKSLIPTSVLGGIILLIISGIYTAITGTNIFNTEFFGGNGITVLENITYHTLALGFIGQALKVSEKKMSKERSREIFDSGVSTVATYLLQAVLGLGITIIISLVVVDFFAAAGVLLPFGYGQGTGQAMNWGGNYQEQGFVGGKTFGLSIAALGFLSAAIGGVIYLNVMKRKGKLKIDNGKKEGVILAEEVEKKDEIPMNGSIDKITVQVALMMLVYGISYVLMYAMGLLFENNAGLKTTIYGFNFLFGVLVAVLLKTVMNKMKKRGILKRQYTNNFLLTRISNFSFDLMVVAGIAAIQLDLIKDYWWILILLGVVGLIATFLYNFFIAKVLFKGYYNEQFLAMYGMLTGTASTGIILLREIDGDFKTPAADNLVYQTLPAIVFGFPLMLLAMLAPVDPILTLCILVVFFVVMNILLFRSKIFKRKKLSPHVDEKDS